MALLAEQTPSKRERKAAARQESLRAQAQQWFDWALEANLIIPIRRGDEVIGYRISKDFKRSWNE